MSELIAAAAAAYAERNTSPPAGTLADVAAWTREQTEAPGMMSGLAEARLLEALIVVGGATQVLEIGTFTAFGTLSMAAALAPGGSVTTLEADPDTAAAARRHIEASPYADRIQLILGDARRTVQTLPGPFDLVYIDAWKADYPHYYEAVVPKLSPRGVIVADNVLRRGLVLRPGGDADTEGMRAFTRRVQEDDRVHNVLLTVGDGLMVAWRRPGE